MVENAFGILAARWQCLAFTMRQYPDVVNEVVVTCIILHNLMRIHHPGEGNQLVDNDDADMNVVPGAWRDQHVMEDLQQARRGALATRAARQQRIYLKNYYNRIGAVPWQQNMI